MFADKNSTQTVVDAATADLSTQWQLVAAGLTLAQTVVEVDGLALTESDYTASSWTTLSAALTAATTALDTTTLPDSAVLDALNSGLRDAVSALAAATGLADTGAEVAPYALGGLLLLLLGGATLLLGRRRRRRRENSTPPFGVTLPLYRGTI